jgi:hypothetical protein
MSHSYRADGCITRNPMLHIISKTKSMAMCGNYTTQLKIVIEGTTTEQVMKFSYSGNRISEFKKDMEYKLQTCNRMKDITNRNSSQKNNKLA